MVVVVVVQAFKYHPLERVAAWVGYMYEYTSERLPEQCGIYSAWPHSKPAVPMRHRKSIGGSEFDVVAASGCLDFSDSAPRAPALDDAESDAFTKQYLSTLATLQQAFKVVDFPLRFPYMSQALHGTVWMWPCWRGSSPPCMLPQAFCLVG